MSLNLVLNSTNVIQNGIKSQYVYNFISGSLTIPKNSQMCISNLTIPYSWFNINQQLYNNASFSYSFPNAAGENIIYNVTLQNGYYAMSDILAYLQTIMIQNGQYLYNTTTNTNVYYISMITNSTYYAIQFILYAVPSSLPANYTNPSNMPFPPTPTTPQIIILNNNFQTICGYTYGSYPTNPANVNQSFLSNTAVNSNPVNALILRCNLIDNNVAMPSDILDSIPIVDTTFGENLNYQPPFPKWMSVKSGKYSKMILTLVDQNYNQINCNDSNILISLLLTINKTNNINK